MEKKIFFYAIFSYEISTSRALLSSTIKTNNRSKQTKTIRTDISLWRILILHILLSALHPGFYHSQDASNPKIPKSNTRSLKIPRQPTMKHECFLFLLFNKTNPKVFEIQKRAGKQDKGLITVFEFDVLEADDDQR